MITHSCLHTHMTRQRVSWPWRLSRQTQTPFLTIDQHLLGLTAMSVNDGGDPSVTPQRELALVCPLPQRQLVLLCPHRLVHMLQTREKQTRRWAALSKHQHACVRLGMQCMQDLMLCVWPDHACLSLGQEACSVHKQGDATAGSGIRVGAGYCK